MEVSERWRRSATAHVVLFGDDGGDQPLDGGVVGEHAHDVGAPLELAPGAA
jgi:hypothetical protein